MPRKNETNGVGAAYRSRTDDLRFTKPPAWRSEGERCKCPGCGACGPFGAGHLACGRGANPTGVHGCSLCFQCCEARGEESAGEVGGNGSPRLRREVRGPVRSADASPVDSRRGGEAAPQGCVVTCHLGGGGSAPIEQQAAPVVEVRTAPCACGHDRHRHDRGAGVCVARLANGRICECYSYREPRIDGTERTARERVIREAGLACLEWVADTGECHLCRYEPTTGHDEECPIRRAWGGPPGAVGASS